MLKLFFVGALLCATAFLGECEMEKPTMSRQMTVTMPKSTTVAMDDQMYTVSMTKSNVHVNSSDENHKPCDMAIDPEKDVIDGEMKVIAANKMMYILGERGRVTEDGQEKTAYVLLIINPQDCTLKSADVPKGDAANVLPELNVQEMGVDLFFPKMKTCAPCQFMNDGTKKDMPPQIPVVQPGSQGWTPSFKIRKMGPNYMYAQHTDDDKTMMKLIDGTTMNVLKEKQIDQSVETMTDTKPELMAVCSKTQDKMMMDVAAYKEISCERLDSKLESQAPIKITLTPHAKTISSVTFNIDMNTGKSYIGFADGDNLHAYVHDADGKELKMYDMGKVDERFEKYQHQPMYYSPYSHWDVRAFIAGNEWCLVTMQVSDWDKHEVDLHDVRCINLEK